MYEKILVPLDGSKAAESVLPHVQGLAKSEGAEIVLVRVAVNPVLEYAFTDTGLAHDIVEKEKHISLQYVNRIAFNIRTAGIRCFPVVGEGPEAATILKISETLHADLIAISTHGLSGAVHWMLGSVAERIIEHSTVPVLLIRPSGSS